MADQWLHMYHPNNLSNNQLPFHLSDHDHPNSGLVSDSTVVTSAVTTPPASSGLSPDGGRVVKPARKRSRASRRTPTTLLNTDAANFRAMVQQFTGGPSNNHPNFPAFGNFPGNNSGHPLFDPSSAAAAYHLAAPPQQQQPPLFQFQNQPLHPPPQQQQQPPFMFSLSNSAGSEAFFDGGARSNSNYNVNYMGMFDGSSPAAQNPRPA